MSISLRTALALTAALIPATGFAADPAPAKILKDAAAAITAQKSMSIAATVEYRGKFQGSEEALDTSYTIDFDRAAGLAVHVENADDEMFVYRTGDKYIHYVPSFKQYTTKEPSDSPEQVVSSTGFQMIEPAMNVLATVVADAPFEGALTPSNLQYIGAEPLDGNPCDRIRFDANGFTVDLWIDQANHQIRRIEPDMKPLEEKFGAEYGTTFDFTVTANLTKWDANADVSKAINFAAPEGVESVARFSAPHEETEAEKMAGSPAPDFTLPLLAGGELTLSKEKGNVVILDFWATWCGPCRVAMPAIHEVAKEFAGKKVRLYSVNGGEDADTVKSFLEQAGLADIPVALDTENQVTELYKANAIPQTVIIGPDGVIRIVHVGLWAMPDGDLPDSQEEAEKAMHEVLVKTLSDEIHSVLATSETKSTGD